MNEAKIPSVPQLACGGQHHPEVINRPHLSHLRNIKLKCDVRGLLGLAKEIFRSSLEPGMDSAVKS